jgi:dolichol-phosphate mannosyltransferase
MDADFSHRPKEIPNFLRRMNEYDLVIGSRYIDGVRVLNWPIQRLMLSYAANVYSRFMTGFPIHDATGGFKCFRRRVLEAVDLDGIRSNGYAFQIEMSYKVEEGFQNFEMSIAPRPGGNSKMSKDIIFEASFHVWLRVQSLNRL